MKTLFSSIDRADNSYDSLNDPGFPTNQLASTSELVLPDPKGDKVINIRTELSSDKAERAARLREKIQKFKPESNSLGEQVDFEDEVDKYEKRRGLLQDIAGAMAVIGIVGVGLGVSYRLHLLPGMNSSQDHKDVASSNQKH